jgi:hypothetical protein
LHLRRLQPGNSQIAKCSCSTPPPLSRPVSARLQPSYTLSRFFAVIKGTLGIPFSGHFISFGCLYNVNFTLFWAGTVRLILLIILERVDQTKIGNWILLGHNEDIWCKPYIHRILSIRIWPKARAESICVWLIAIAFVVRDIKPEVGNESYLSCCSRSAVVEPELICCFERTFPRPIAPIPFLFCYKALFFNRSGYSLTGEQ